MRTLCVVSLLALLFCGCNSDNGGTAAVPRPRAYPRVALYDASRYVFPDSFPVMFPVNAAAEHTLENHSGGGAQNAWLTVRYPRYGLAVYITCAEASDSVQLARIVDNRLERIGLNIGDNAMVDHVAVDNPYGFYSRLLLTRSVGSPAPVNFIAIGTRDDGSGAVVSGSAVLESEAAITADADSIAPVVKAIIADISHSLSQIRFK